MFKSGQIPMPLNANGVSSAYGADKLFLIHAIEGSSLLNVSWPPDKAGMFHYPSTMPGYGPTWMDQWILPNGIYVLVKKVLGKVKIKMAFWPILNQPTDN